jgi:hypothetical protein
VANVAARIPADDHVRRQPWLAEIERQWGPAPGRQNSDGSGILVLGATFGNVFVGIQPGFGYEGDPMRLLFEHGFAPTHAFAAFYRWIREEYGADAVLHFGTHGALEFMPGKQAGMSAECWPDRLIADLPNYYLYASNNPSEGMLAKRRANIKLGRRHGSRPMVADVAGVLAVGDHGEVLVAGDGLQLREQRVLAEVATVQRVCEVRRVVELGGAHDPDREPKPLPQFHGLGQLTPWEAGGVRDHRQRTRPKHVVRHAGQQDGIHAAGVGHEARAIALQDGSQPRKPQIVGVAVEQLGHDDVGEVPATAS